MIEEKVPELQQPTRKGSTVSVDRIKAYQMIKGWLVALEETYGMLIVAEMIPYCKISEAHKNDLDDAQSKGKMCYTINPQAN